MKRSNSMVAAIAMLVTAIGIVGRGFGATTITSAVLCRDYTDGEAKDITTTFGPADRKVHVVLKFPKIVKAQLRFVWLAVKAKDAAGQVYKNVKIQEKTIPTQLMDHAHGSVELDRDWPVGDYRLDIYVDSNLAKTLSYTVK